MTIENTTEGRGYDLPAPPNRLSDDVLRLIAALGKIDVDVVNLLSLLAGKANTTHGHAIADVSGLETALAGKAGTGHNHTLASLNGVSITSPATGQVLRYSGTDWVNAALAIADVTNLSSTITGLSNADTALTGALATLSSTITGLSNADTALTSALATLTGRVDTIDGGTY